MQLFFTYVFSLSQIFILFSIFPLTPLPTTELSLMHAFLNFVSRSNSFLIKNWNLLFPIFSITLILQETWLLRRFQLHYSSQLTTTRSYKSYHYSHVWNYLACRWGFTIRWPHTRQRVTTPTKRDVLVITRSCITWCGSSSENLDNVE